MRKLKRHEIQIVLKELQEEIDDIIYCQGMWVKCMYLPIRRQFYFVTDEKEKYIEHPLYTIVEIVSLYKKFTDSESEEWIHEVLEGCKE